MIENMLSTLCESLLQLIGYRGIDFTKALSEFICKEQFLLENDINERTLTHKLAEYLQKYFPDYNVDCEYNRMMQNEDYVKKTLKLPTEQTVEISDITQRTVYPDIIIHRRGNNNNNLLVIEVKKSANRNNKDFDSWKLEAFTTQLNYRLGLYLEFNENGISDFALYQKGKKIGASND